MPRMDYYGNMFDDAGNFTGVDFYKSQCWRDSVESAHQQDAASAAVVAAEANLVRGIGTEAQVAAAQAAKIDTLRTTNLLGNAATVAKGQEGLRNGSTLTQTYENRDLSGGPAVFSVAIEPKVLMASTPEQTQEHPFLWVSAIALIWKFFL